MIKRKNIIIIFGIFLFICMSLFHYFKVSSSRPLNVIEEELSLEEISEKIKKMSQEIQGDKPTSEGRDALTRQGDFALQLVQESTQSFARQNIEDLISANKKARMKRSG